MYGFAAPSPAVRESKSTSLTRASPQCRDFRCNQDTAVVWKFRTSGAHSRRSRNRQPRAFDSHPCAALQRGGAGPATQSDSQTGFTLPLVLHRPCARFGNNQCVSDNHWQRLCPPTLVDPRTTQCRSARTIAVYIHRPNRTTALRTARAYRCTSLYNLRAHSFAQLSQHLTGMSSPTRTKQRHHGCTHRIAIARSECHNCSVVFWRSRVSTGYSQAITAELSAGCKALIHANSTLIPLQTHGNR